MHWSLVPERARALDDGLPPPPVPAVDIHMHLGDAETSRLYVEAARAYGVDRALALPCGFEGVTDPLRDAFGDFFIPCAWPREFVHGDWNGFRERWIDGFDRLLEAEVRSVKFKSSPGRDGEKPDWWLDDDRLAPFFERCARHGLLVQAHIAQPSCWWPERFDPAVCGPKRIYLEQVERLLRAHPDLDYLGVHMGGIPEDLEYLDHMATTFPRYHLDTSATKWIVRELSARRDAARAFFIRHADRVCFGSDLVVGMGDGEADYYTSRFHVQRTMWESDHRRRSMIADPDAPADGPFIDGLALPEDVLRKLYRDNALRLLGMEPR